jgi:hypothetical protein
VDIVFLGDYDAADGRGGAAQLISTFTGNPTSAATDITIV